jgi:hypothetical protein
VRRHGLRDVEIPAAGERDNLEDVRRIGGER